jgi:25S rRNA (adenine2142-N1)-methyltransferase
LLKRRTQLEHIQDRSLLQVQKLADIDGEIARLGGLEKYQQMSVNGQKEERGGGSEKIFIAWMKELNLHHKHKGSSNRLRCVIDGVRFLIADMNLQPPGSWRTQTR